MKRISMTRLTAICLSALCMGATGANKDDGVTLRANLRGANEVPSIFTAGTGRFTADIHPNGTIDFTLTFANLSANATVSHIHFAPPNVNGGIMIFLCGGGGQPSCPAATFGTVVGTISPANVVS